MARGSTNDGVATQLNSAGACISRYGTADAVG
jgi:hypothetical protein